MYAPEIEAAFEAFDEITYEMGLVAEIGAEGLTDEAMQYERLVQLRQHAARILDSAARIALSACNPAPAV